MTEGFSQEELDRFFSFVERMRRNLEQCGDLRE